MGTYKDTVPVNTTTKERIKRLQTKVAIIKGMPSSISQIDLMEIMTAEFEGTADGTIEKLPKQ
jgi:adenylate kinase family enzyme